MTKDKYNKDNIIQFRVFVVVLMTIMFMLNVSTIYEFRKSNSDITDVYYESNAIENLKQNSTKIIGDYCDLYKSNISKVMCVNNFVVDSGLFNYTRTNNILLTDELLKKGGDCKSWTTFYKGLFNYMGIESNIIHSKHHVYLNVFDENFYCNIDQSLIECTLLK